MPDRIVIVREVARRRVQLEMEPAVGAAHRHAAPLAVRDRIGVVPSVFRVMPPDVDRGPGDRLAVRVEHPAANRERAGRVERSPVSGCGTAVSALGRDGERRGHCRPLQGLLVRARPGRPTPPKQ